MDDHRIRAGGRFEGPGGDAAGAEDAGPRLAGMGVAIFASARLSTWLWNAQPARRGDVGTPGLERLGMGAPLGPASGRPLAGWCTLGHHIASTAIFGAVAANLWAPTLGSAGKNGWPERMSDPSHAWRQLMGIYVERLEGYGIYDRFDIAVDFAPGVNVLYGRNGTGKTTSLHILANALNQSYDRFAFLRFDRICVFLSGVEIQIRRIPDATQGGEIIVLRGGQETHRLNIGEIQQRVASLRRERPDDVDGEEISGEAVAAYFPAFRTMIEAWYDEYSSSQEAAMYGVSHPRYRRSYRDRRLTAYARRLFGHFVPSLSYPSPREIEDELNALVRGTAYRVAAESQSILTDAFLDAFAALAGSERHHVETPEAILQAIKELLEELDQRQFDMESGSEGVYERLRQILPSLRKGGLSETAASVLSVYRESLTRRIGTQRHAFEPIERYLDTVNEFLEE